MKKMLCTAILAASVTLCGCQNQPGAPAASGTPDSPATPAASTTTPEPDAATATATPATEAGLPFDLKAKAPDAKPGQFVFVPMASSVEKLMNGTETRFSDMRPRELVKTGEETSTIKDREEYEVPNALIIPTDPEANVAVGDIVLANPQYSSWEVAMVTDAADPTAPTVHFFKPVYSGQSPEGDKFSGQLEAGKFKVLNEELEPGTRALYPDGEEQGYGQVIHVSGDQALVTKFGGDLAVFSTGELKPIPVKPNLKEGDQVMAPFAKGMDAATVTKVDDQIGRIWVTFEGRESQGPSVFCYGQVLPAQ